MQHADENRTGELARNVAMALRFKKSQGTPAMPQGEKEVLAPDYNRARGGNLHLAANARDTDFTHSGLYLRKALPDRVDVIERVVADGRIAESRTFADEFGLSLQLGAPNLLLA